MRPHRFVDRAGLSLVLLTFAIAAAHPQSQVPSRTPRLAEPTPHSVSSAPRDTVVAANTQFLRSSLWRTLFGNGYRDVWATPIRVPVLDLTTYAGGLRPLKEGGTKQTKTLHMVARNGVEYVFRPVNKRRLAPPDSLRSPLIDEIFRDQISASYPAAPIVAAPIIEAAGVLHATPQLFVMPDDTLLGEFRKDFAGELGAIEERATKPDDAPAFANAKDIIDSDDLLKKLNKDPREHVDSRAFLTARVVDMLIGDNDRHPGQWNWARLRSGQDAPWEPIPNDRDKAFVSYEGELSALARFIEAQLVTFGKHYPRNMTAMFANAVEFDRRLLAGLNETVWDSVTSFVQHAVTDSVINAALLAAPQGYQGVSPKLAAKLRARRARLPTAVHRYYRALFAEADVHATDAADRATIVRSADGVVDVRLQSGNAAPYFERRFNEATTKEIRVYLHEGDDTAVVIGHPRKSIMVRVIGGNGTNTLIDSSTVGGQRHLARLYDVGHVEKWSYRADTVSGVVYKPDTSWNRRPWVTEYDEPSPPERDRGTTSMLIPGGITGADLGFAPQVQYTRTRYGFRSYPYLSRYDLLAGFSTLTSGARVELRTDNRRENSSWHALTDEFFSQVELIEFHGFGNDTSHPPGQRFYDVRQNEWMAHPAVGFAINSKSDISVGPVIKYVSTDSSSDRYISRNPPYGFGRFGQAGAQLDLRYDSRDDPGFPHHGVIAQFSASAYPKLWDNTQGPFEKLTAAASSYLTFPVGTRPVLALRAGGMRVFGDFPYFEGAYVGGAGTLRTYQYREFVGDASVYGTAELRVPVAKFSFLVPLNTGVLAFTDAGRVYVDGKSPGGWHSVAGGGFWLGLVNPSTGVTLLLSNRVQQRVSLGVGFYF
jgi:surface antigen Omp85-like protein